MERTSATGSWLKWARRSLDDMVEYMRGVLWRRESGVRNHGIISGGECEGLFEMG